MKQVIYNPDLKKATFSAYPRPQMKRNSYLCLNGEWDFDITEEKTRPGRFSSKICVPFPPESALSGICKTPEKGELLHYRRTFSIPEGFKKDRMFLHFGAIDQVATVYLNGVEIGSHAGGYLPFSFEITDYIKEENDLYICVRDDLSFALPYGKQTRKRGGMWYTPTSGIWQTVWIESTPKESIRSLKITPSIASVTIEVECDIKEKTLILKESGKRFTFSGNSITVTPEKIRPWTPETPYLYEFTLLAGEDSVESYFALREIGIQRINGVPRICLNGKPYFIQALLDQGYYPGGHFLPASENGYEEDILAVKRMGYNTLRKHIKIEPLIFYYLCDKLGMIVFQDMVNNGKYSFLRDTALPTVGFLKRNDRKKNKDRATREIFEASMKETIAHLYNSPSVLLYTIFNEGWGQFCADRMYQIAKEADPTRIFDSTSGWFWQKESDVDSLHVYFKPLKKQPLSERPLLISEFGGYSLRINGHLLSKKNYGYKSFKDKEAFFSALRSLYLDQALPLVSKGLCGLVYTQIADVEDETNGLFTHDRLVKKVDEEKMHEILANFSKEYESL